MPNEYSTVTVRVTNKSAILIIWVFSYLSVGIKFPTYTIEAKLHRFQQLFCHEKHQTVMYKLVQPKRKNSTNFTIY